MGAAWERHGRDMGTAWARHAMCESALNSLHRGKCTAIFRNINCFDVTETYTTSTVRLKIWFFWCVASFRLVEERKRFEGTCCVGPFCPTMKVACFWILISLIKRGHTR